MATTVKALCQMCFRNCGMNLFVENGRVVKTEGMPEHPLSKGGLCPKGLAAVQYQYDPRRLTHPLKRAGERGQGRWQEIPWDEAMGITANELQRAKAEHGAQSIVFYTIHSLPYVMRFMNVLGSPNIASHSHLCTIPTIMGQIYTVGGVVLPDIENTSCVVLWGSNPFATTLVTFGRRLLDAQQRGAKLVVVDPRFSAAAAKSDLWVRPRPGTDGALALGMLNVILREGLYDKEFIEKWTYGFERLAEVVRQYTPSLIETITGVPVATIEEAARLYANSKPACIGVGNGIDQHAGSVQASRAIATLMAVSGNLDRPGGNVFPVRPALANITLGEKLPSQTKAVDKHPLYYPLWRVPGSDMVDALLTGEPYPLKAMVVMSGDPVMALSSTSRTKEALKKLDFLVVHDLFMTATAELADIVLPAASWLESTQISPYSFSTLAAPPLDTQLIALHNKAVEPPGECHSNLDFVFELARRLGYAECFPWETAEDAFDAVLKPQGINVDSLKQHPGGIMKTIGAQELYRKYERRGFATPTGEVELYSTVFEKYGYDPLPSFKGIETSLDSETGMAGEYSLLGCATIKPVLFTGTQFHTVPWLNERMPEPWIEIHPQQASDLGVEDGELVAVESPQGRIKVKARLAEDIDPGTVFISHGWGQPYAHGQADNDITPDSPRCPISGSTPNGSFRCRIRKL